MLVLFAELLDGSTSCLMPEATMQLQAKICQRFAKLEGLHDDDRFAELEKAFTSTASFFRGVVENTIVSAEQV